MVLYRPATPADVPAPICLYLAADEVFDYLWGKQYGPRLCAADFRSRRGMFSHLLVMVAESDGEVVGAIGSFGGRRNTRVGLETAWRAARSVPLKMPAGLLRLRGVSTVVPAPDRDAYYLAYVGVLPEYRGQGIGTGLLLQAIDVAGRLKYERLQLDTSTAKPANRRLYERLGFQVVRRHHFDGPPDTIPDYWRMERRTAAPAWGPHRG